MEIEIFNTKNLDVLEKALEGYLSQLNHDLNLMDEALAQDYNPVLASRFCDLKKEEINTTSELLELIQEQNKRLKFQMLRERP